MRPALALVLCASLGCGRRDVLRMSAPPLPDASRPADTVAPPPDDEMIPPKTPLPGPLTPIAADCNVSCPGLEPLGPLVELMPPHEESEGRSSVTFAGGHWYVAWGGRPSVVTHLQRLTSDGQPDGPSLRIEGTTPTALRPTAAGDGLFLLGWVAPAYTAAGYMTSVHSLGLDLAAAGPPILLRAPGTLIMGQSIELGAAGELMVTNVLDRAGGLVREVRIPLAQPAGALLPQRDWRPGPVDSVIAFDRIGDQRVFLDVAGGALRMRSLLDDGTIGAATSIFEVPAAEGRQVVFSRRVGDGWWVGAWAATTGPLLVRLRAVDPQTRAAIGELITLKWPTAGPSAVVDANGTPMLLGHLASPGNGISLVPIDAAARAACPPSAVKVDGLAGRFQTIRAIHFQGDTAGVTLDSWLSGPRRVFFARLRCTR